MDFGFTHTRILALPFTPSPPGFSFEETRGGRPEESAPAGHPGAGAEVSAEAAGPAADARRKGSRPHG